MYRDDREALSARADSATREADLLRRENEAMRRAIAGQVSHPMTTLALPPATVYSALDLRLLPLEERARLARHDLRRFPVWAAGILNVLTLGLFPLIHFGLVHNQLPRAGINDPSSGKAIGFAFIPYYNFYWVFFSALRLSDRLTLQYRIRGVNRTAPRGIVLAACVLTVIPYVNFLVGIPILWTIAVCRLQASVNELAALGPDGWDASSPSDAPVNTLAGLVLESTAEQRSTMAKAQRLVTWSHLLGWGGLGFLIVGSSAAAIASGGTAAAVVGATSMVVVVVGAIIGQVGRAMQGRAI